MALARDHQPLQSACIMKLNRSNNCFRRRNQTNNGRKHRPLRSLKKKVDNVLVKQVKRCSKIKAFEFTGNISVTRSCIRLNDSVKSIINSGQVFSVSSEQTAVLFLYITDSSSSNYSVHKKTYCFSSIFMPFGSICDLNWCRPKQWL